MLLEHDDLAAGEFRTATELNPLDYEAWFHYGVTLSILEDEEKAAEAFEKALVSTPPVSQHFKLGLAYFSLKRYEEAIHELSMSVNSLEPHPITMRIKLGVAYLRLNRYDECIEILSDAIRLNADVCARYYNAYFFLGLAYHSLGKLDDAILAYRKSIETRPEVSFSYINLGAVYLALGDKKMAAQQYRSLKLVDAEAAKAMRDYLKIPEE